MSKCKITGKVLAIQLGRDETRIALVNNGVEILHRVVVTTPMGAVDDGMIRNMDAVLMMLKGALAAPEFKRTRQTVFTLCTTQVVTEVVSTPVLAEAKLEKLLHANMDTYFPAMDTQDYQLIWQTIGTKTSEAGVKELDVQLWAVPTQMVSRYYTVANACGLSVAAIDYCGHSIVTAVGASFARPQKNAKDKKAQAAQMAAAVGEADGIDLYITLEKDILGMTFVQAGQVRMQRFIRCGFIPSHQFSELVMVLEYFRALEYGRSGNINGIVSGTLAWDTDVVSELQEVLGITLAAQQAEFSPHWAMCIGAVRTEMDFGIPLLNKPGKARKQVQSQLWQYGLVLAGGLALMGAILMNLSSQLVWDSELRTLNATKQTLTVKMQQTAGFSDNFKKYQSAYNNYSADWDTIFSSLKTYNDNLVLVLEELEETLPQNASVTGLQIAADGITVQFACENKEVAAYLIMALRQMKYTDIVSISNISGGGSGPMDSYGPNGFLGSSTEAPPTEGDGFDSVQGLGESIGNMISAELNQDELVQLALNLTPEEYALLEQVYGMQAATKYASLEALKDANADMDPQKFFEHRCNALRSMLTSNPFAANRFVELMKEDFRRDEEAILWWYIIGDMIRLEQEGAFGGGSMNDPSTLMQYMNVLLEVLTKDETTLTATEKLICTDKPTELWYVYYLEVELGKQVKNPFPYLNMEQIAEDVLEGGFDTGNETLDGKLNGLISEEAWEKIDKMTSAEGMEEMFNKYLETGSTGDENMDALLKEYLEKGSTGYDEVDKFINEYIDAGKMDDKMADMLDKYLNEGTTGNDDLDKLINNYLEKGTSGNQKLDGVIDSFVESDEMNELLEEMFNKYLTDGSTGSDTLDTFINNYLTNGSTGSEKLDGVIADYISSGSMNDKLADLLEKYAKDGTTGIDAMDQLMNNYLTYGTTGNPELDKVIQDYISEMADSFTEAELTKMVQNYMANGTTGNKLYDILLKKYMETGSTGIPALDAMIDKFVGGGDGDDDPSGGFDRAQIEALIQKYMKDGTTGVPFYDNMIDKYLKYGTTGVPQLDAFIEDYISKELDAITEAQILDMINKYMTTGTTGNKLYDKLINKYMAEGTTGNTKLDKLIMDAILGGGNDNPGGGNDNPGDNGGNGGNGDNGGNGGTTQPADTRNFFTVTFAYNEELKNAELDRKGLNNEDKIGKLEVAGK